MPNVAFRKMHGLGNDYIYFDCVRDQTHVPAIIAAAERLSDRHFGIGGDGIVLVLPDDDADFRMRMFNADGSEAEMCGNAIRCVGKLLYDEEHTGSTTVRVATGAGIKVLTLTAADGVCTAARVDMGEPILHGPTIPVAVDADPVVGAPVRLSNGTEHVMTCVSMGNPHAVIFVDEIADALVLGDGPELECHELFPRRINVEFARILSRSAIQMRVWERGSGETLACGTGACATAVAAVLNGLTDRRVQVRLLGGDLDIEWAEADNHVFMTGPAATVFDGTVEV